MDVSLGGGLALCAASYLYGSVPFVALLARGQVDLTRYGSGNVGAGNLWAAAGAARGLAGGLGDVSKGLLPVLGARLAGLPVGWQALVGACGVAGQAWPVWLRFHGGRGQSAYLGATFGLSPLAFAIAAVPMAAGALWRLLPALARRRHNEGSSTRRTRRERRNTEEVDETFQHGGHGEHTEDTEEIHRGSLIMPSAAHPAEELSQVSLPVPAQDEPRRDGQGMPGTTNVARAPRSQAVPLGGLLGVLAFPPAYLLLAPRGAFPAGALSALPSLLVVLRRLTAPLPDDAVAGPRVTRRALLYRLLYDRNTRE